MFLYDPATNPLNNNEWSFPLPEIIHIAGFALSIGTIACVDLRLLGLGLLRRSSQQVWKDTFPWTLTGLIIMLTTGPAIFSSDPVMYLHNQSFEFKLVAMSTTTRFTVRLLSRTGRLEKPTCWRELYLSRFGFP